MAIPVIKFQKLAKMHGFFFFLNKQSYMMSRKKKKTKPLNMLELMEENNLKNNLNCTKGVSLLLSFFPSNEDSQSQSKRDNQPGNFLYSSHARNCKILYAVFNLLVGTLIVLLVKRKHSIQRCFRNSFLDMWFNFWEVPCGAKS